MDQRIAPDVLTSFIGSARDGFLSASADAPFATSFNWWRAAHLFALQSASADLMIWLQPVPTMAEAHFPSRLKPAARDSFCPLPPAEAGGKWGVG
jgi:hypothetical protein